MSPSRAAALKSCASSNTPSKNGTGTVARNALLAVKRAHAILGQRRRGLHRLLLQRIGRRDGDAELGLADPRSPDVPYRPVSPHRFARASGATEPPENRRRRAIRATVFALAVRSEVACDTNVAADIGR